MQIKLLQSRSLNKNSIIIHNPIFYDLGFKFEESLITVKSISDLITQSFPSWNELKQNYEFMAYNFSYLSLHLPSVIYNVAEKIISVLGVEVVVKLNVSIRVNGTICFEYQYIIDNSQSVDIAGIVKELQGYINVSYKRYLQRSGEFKNSMTKLKLPEYMEVDSIFDDGFIIDTLKRLLEKNNIGVLNNYVYPYQHGRLLFECAFSNEVVKNNLLSAEFKSKATEVSGGGIFLDTWKTVIISDNEKSDVFLDLYFENLANFFQCQKWIFQCEFMLKTIDDKMMKKEHKYNDLSQQAKDIESLYFSCNRKMINYTNLSIPFKNDYYSDLSRTIINAIKLEQHIEQTHKHFSALKEHINTAKIHIDTRTEKHTKILKIFMALNFSAGIASLIPASLDGDLTKFGTSMLPPVVWVTFSMIAFTVFFLESRNKK